MVFGTDATDLKLEDIQIHDFGQVGEVTITKDDTLFLKGKGNQKDIGKFWLFRFWENSKFEFSQLRKLYNNYDNANYSTYYIFIL